MGQIRIEAEGFSLVSQWRVVTGSNGSLEIIEGPSTAKKTVTFEYKIPGGIKVKNAKVHSTWGSPLSGYAIRRVNGVTPDADGMVTVVIDPDATSIDVVFTFKANGNTTSTGYHSGAATLSDVYLVIETEDGCIYHVEDGVLVPYVFHQVENGVLVPYRVLGTLGYPEVVVTIRVNSDGEATIEGATLTVDAEDNATLENATLTVNMDGSAYIE